MAFHFGIACATCRLESLKARAERHKQQALMPEPHTGCKSPLPMCHKPQAVVGTPGNRRFTKCIRELREIEGTWKHAFAQHQICYLSTASSNSSLARIVRDWMPTCAQPASIRLLVRKRQDWNVATLTPWNSLGTPPKRNLHSLVRKALRSIDLFISQLLMFRERTRAANFAF